MIVVTRPIVKLCGILNFEFIDCIVNASQYCQLISPLIVRVDSTGTTNTKMSKVAKDGVTSVAGNCTMADTNGLLTTNL